MTKLNREMRLRERRMEKQARKAARKLASGSDPDRPHAPPKSADERGVQLPGNPHS